MNFIDEKVYSGYRGFEDLKTLLHCKPKIIERAVEKVPVIVGDDYDKYGCKLSAGYAWCEVNKRCQKALEEDCKINTPEGVEDINRILQNNEIKINDFTQAVTFDFTDTIYESQRIFYKFSAIKGQSVRLKFESGATLYIYSEPDFLRKEFVKGGTGEQSKTFVSQTGGEFYLEIERTGLPISKSADMSTMQQGVYTLWFSTE